MCALDLAGKYSVPVLWDTKEKTIVNNESSGRAAVAVMGSCGVRGGGEGGGDVEWGGCRILDF